MPSRTALVPTIREPKQVGLWIRVSTEDQVKGESPEHHERRARLYAESKEWNVVEVYRLDGVSGKDIIALPEAQRMLSDIRSGKITGLIFSKLARLARNTKQLLDFSEIFRECGADLISLQESIDTSTPAGRLFYTMIAAMAQWEREEIAERVAASVPIRAKLGKPLGGTVPFGYRWEGRVLKTEPKEAEVRKLVFELFAEHKRPKRVARLLNEAGHRTRNGSKFTDTTIKHIIRDPISKGDRRTNYTRGKGDGKNWVMKPETEWVMMRVEPIVSEELWTECNGIIDARRSKTTPQPGRKVVHLFAGKVFCTCDGSPKMYVRSGSSKYVCMECRNKIGSDDLDHIFREQLRDFFSSSEQLVTYIEQADKEIADRKTLLDSLLADQKKVTQEMEKVYQLYVGDQISADGFGRTYRPLEERAKQLDNEIPRLQAELDYLKIQHLSRDEVVSKAQDVYAHWPELQREVKQAILDDVVERIVVDKTEVEIKLAYVPSPFEIAAKRQHNHRA